MYTIPFAVAAAILLTLVTELLALSWWLTFIVWFTISILFLHPFIENEMDYGCPPDVADVIEDVKDALNGEYDYDEDEEEGDLQTIDW